MELAEAQACGEQRFWDVLRRDWDQRIEVRGILSAAIEEHTAEGGTSLSRLHFQRGQLSMAIAIEQGEVAYMTSVVPDIDRAMELDPDNPILATWKDSMEIAIAHLFGDDLALAAALERAWVNVDAFPMGNVLSISGTTIGLPLSTGAPQRTVELLDAWECEGVA